MDNPRAEKVAVVDEVRQRLDESDAAILTEYRGLKVKELAQLRRGLAPVGGEYRVYKNTLVRFAARDAGLGALEPMLEGPTGIAFVKGDAAAVAKSLRDYARTQPLLIIKGGVLGDKVLSAGQTAALADLPSREVLLSRLAGGIAAPLQQMAGLLQALPRNMAYGLAALRDQRLASGEDAGNPAGDAVATEAAEPLDTETAEPLDTETAEPLDTETAEPLDTEQPVAAEPASIAEAATGIPDIGSITPESLEALDAAESPILAAEAADPAPSE